MENINKERKKIGRRGFMKTIGSLSCGLGLSSFTYAANKADINAKIPIAHDNEHSTNIFKTEEQKWLAPDYKIIAQLPPDQAGGYFMAMSIVKMSSGNLIAAIPWGKEYPDGGRSLRSLLFYNSTDNGENWEAVSKLPYDSCEPNLYVYEERLYLIITPNQNNSKLERSYFPRDGKWGIWACVSDDEGKTWSTIQRVLQGELEADKQVPRHSTGGQTAMVIHNNQLYLTVSDNFRELAVASCQLEKGILNSDAWRVSKMVELPIPPELYHGPSLGSQMRVLEGNVVKVGERLLVIARAVINGGATANMGAVFEILDDGKEKPLSLKFLQFYPIPGGQMKFYILYDEPSKLFWMASSPASNSLFLIEEGDWGRAKLQHRRATERRSLMLWYSIDSLNWFPCGWIAFADGWSQSFHYPVMIIDGNDIAIISRTAFKSSDPHDVDMATFHRIKNFRNLAMELTPKF